MHQSSFCRDLQPQLEIYNKPKILIKLSKHLKNGIVHIWDYSRQKSSIIPVSIVKFSLSSLIVAILQTLTPKPK